MLGETDEFEEFEDVGRGGSRQRNETPSSEWSLVEGATANGHSPVFYDDEEDDDEEDGGGVGGGGIRITDLPSERFQGFEAIAAGLRTHESAYTVQGTPQAASFRPHDAQVGIYAGQA